MEEERESAWRSLFELVVAILVLGLTAWTILSRQPIEMVRSWIDGLGGSKALIERLTQYLPFLIVGIVFFLGVQLARSYLDSLARRPRRPERLPGGRRSPRPIERPEEALPLAIVRPLQHEVPEEAIATVVPPPTDPVEPEPAPAAAGTELGPALPESVAATDGAALSGTAMPVDEARETTGDAPDPGEPLFPPQTAPLPFRSPPLQQVSLPLVEEEQGPDEQVPAASPEATFDQHEKIRRFVDDLIGGSLASDPARLMAEWCLERIQRAALHGVVLRRVDREDARVTLYFGHDTLEGSTAALMRVSTLLPQFRELGARCEIDVEKGSLVVVTFDKLKPAMLPSEVVNRGLDQAHLAPLLIPVGTLKRRDVWINLEHYEKLLVAGDNRSTLLDLVRSLTFLIAAYAHPRFVRIALVDQHLMDDFRKIPHLAFSGRDPVDTLDAITQEYLARLRMLMNNGEANSAAVYNLKAELRMPILLVVIPDLPSLPIAAVTSMLRGRHVMARAGVYVLAAAPGAARDLLAQVAPSFLGRISTSTSDLEIAKLLVSSKQPAQIKPTEGVLAQPGESSGSDTLVLNILPSRIVGEGLSTISEREKLVKAYAGAFPVPLSGESELGEASAGSDLDGLDQEVAPAPGSAPPLAPPVTRRPSLRPAPVLAEPAETPAPVPFVEAVDGAVLGTGEERPAPPAASPIHDALEDLVDKAQRQGAATVPGAPAGGPGPTVAEGASKLTEEERFERDLVRGLPEPPALEGVERLPDDLRSALEMTLRFGSISGPRLRREVLPAHANRDVTERIMPILYLSQILDMTLPMRAPKRPLVVNDRVQAYRQVLDAFRRYEEDPSILRDERKKELIWGRAASAPDLDAVVSSEAAGPDRTPQIILDPLEPPAPRPAVAEVPAREVASVPQPGALPAELVRLLDVSLRMGYASALILQKEAGDIPAERVNRLYFPTLVESGVLAAELNGRAIPITSAVIVRPVAVTDREAALERLAEVWPRVRAREEGR